MAAEPTAAARAVATYRAGDYGRALEWAERALAARPHAHAHAIGVAIAAADRLRCLATREPWLMQVLEPLRGDPHGETLVGELHLRAGRAAAARVAFERALAADPCSHGARAGLARALAREGELDEARRLLAAGAGRWPDVPAYPLARAAVELGGGNAQSCVDALRPLLARGLPHVELYELLADAYERLELHERATASLRQWVSLRPRDAAAHARLAQSLARCGEHERAIGAWRQAVALAPDFQAARTELAAALIRQGHIDDAAQQVDMVLRVDPASARATLLLGHLHAIRGDDEAARHSFRHALALEPELVEAWEALADAEEGSPPEDLVDRGPALLDRVPTAAERRVLRFALGRLASRAGDHAAAWRHYVAANGLQRERLAARRGFDDPDLSAFEAALLRAFPEASGPARECLDAHLPKPIFIVGMPRSGTTLVERILGQAPGVRTGGELGKLPSLAREVMRSASLFDGDPGRLAALSRDARLVIADRYRTSLDGGDGARFVTDKLPANFVLVGWIRQLFPDAPIIHLHRDPADTILSCFTRRFDDQNPFMCDLARLVDYAGFHARVAAHWVATVGSRYLPVQYEALVADPAGVVATLAAHCSLAADAPYLDFHRSRAPVRTFSRSQVRRPIRAPAAGPWERYGPHVDPDLAARIHGLRTAYSAMRA